MQLLIEKLDSFCTVFLHFFSYMSVHVQSKLRTCMTEICLNGFDVIARTEGSYSKAVPLRYNYDKPGKPRISRVFGYLARFFILFQTEKSSREVVISQGVL